MKIVVGLGNPGPEYENTRHNLGFRIIDELAQKLNVEVKKKKFNGYYYQGKNFLLVKPQTYINNSGKCVAGFVDSFSIPKENLLVIYDDISLPLGSLRYRSQGSGGGHNGVNSIILRLMTKQFKRLRIGVGYNQKIPLTDWVLGRFTEEEKQELEAVLSRAVAGLIEWIQEEVDFEKIMGNYNQKIKNVDINMLSNKKSSMSGNQNLKELKIKEDKLWEKLIVSGGSTLAVSACSPVTKLVFDLFNKGVGFFLKKLFGFGVSNGYFDFSQTWINGKVASIVLSVYFLVMGIYYCRQWLQVRREIREVNENE